MTRASRTTGRVQQACLTVASVVGVLAIAWFLLSVLLGWSLVLFKTGSMAPTYPTGAAAVAVPASAEQVEVGDVVTVQRDAGGLPVTHRVVQVADPGAGDGTRELVLQGDANATADREVYTVTDVDRIVVGAPYVGYAVTLLAQPASLAILTAALTGLTVWVFWPSGSAGRGEHDDGHGHDGDDGDDHRAGARVGHGANTQPPQDAVLADAPHGPATTRAMLREARGAHEQPMREGTP